MGFNTDTRGKPEFTDTPAQTVADLQAAADFADKVGGLLKGTSTERDLLSAGEVATGWLFSETDTGYLYRRVTAGWELVAGDSGWITPTLGAGWSAYAGEVFKYRLLNGVVYLAGRASGSSAAGTLMFTLPPAFRHAYTSDLVFQAHSDFGTQIIVVSPSGGVIIVSNTGAVRQGVSLSGVRFPTG